MEVCVEVSFFWSENVGLEQYKKENHEKCGTFEEELAVISAIHGGIPAVPETERGHCKTLLGIS